MKILYTALLIILSTAAIAQSNYHEGFVVKNNGDTLKGFINYREWAQCPRLIDFKINKDDKQALRFDPHTIKEFQINGMETYVAYKGIISMDRTRFPDLPLGLDTSKKQDTIFIKQVVTGRYLTLYYHKDEIKVRFFIAEMNSQPIELKFFQYYGDENKAIIKDTYKGQLIYYVNQFMPGNTKLNKEVEDVGYTQDDLEAIISIINGGDANPVKRKSYITFFAGFGMNNTKTQLDDGTHYISTATNYLGTTNITITTESVLKTSVTTSPRIDLGINMFANPNVQQFIFRAELSFSYINAKFQYPVYVHNTSIDTNVNSMYAFNQYSVRVTPQILFNFYNKNNFKVYIDAGIGFNFSAYTNNKMVVGDVTSEKPYDLESYWANFPLQVGVILNRKLEFAFTYIGYTAYTKYSNFSISNQSMDLGVKYLFGGK